MPHIVTVLIKNTLPSKVSKSTIKALITTANELNIGSNIFKKILFRSLAILFKKNLLFYFY